MFGKFTFTLIICLSCILVLKAQQGIKYNMKSSGLHATAVRSKDSADFFRILFPPDTSEKDLFIVNDFYKNGKPKMVGKSHTSDPNNLDLQGPYIKFFDNGVKQSEGQYDNNQLMGE